VRDPGPAMSVAIPLELGYPVGVTMTVCSVLATAGGARFTGTRATQVRGCIWHPDLMHELDDEWG
jgi:hypothetical protein